MLIYKAFSHGSLSVLPASPVVALFIGSIAPDEAFKAASSAKQESTRIGYTCEADFFVGVQQIAKGVPAAARSLLRSAVDHCPHGFFQYAAANFELKRLDGSDQLGH
jgi:lipoprotein NlpI